MKGRSFDAVVVGAGPAGLAAAAELSARGSCLVVEAGPVAAVRRRDSPDDILAGVGGAGLYSDGKHSLYPSASALWALPDRAALAGAYAATAALLGVPGELPADPPPALPHGAWCEKAYPAIYVPYADRLACIERLWAACGERRAGVGVTGVRRDGAALIVTTHDGDVRTRALVVATGRWSPRWIRPWLEPLGVAFAYRRLELGVRIETRADHALFARLPGVDGKLVFRRETSEIRTFCTCRDGEVVLGRSHGIAAYSGRADGPATGRSNVGLVVRQLAPTAWSVPDPVAFALRDWPDALPPALRESCELLHAWQPLPDDARIYAPCLEGVGDYPVDDGSLQLAPNVWIAGDACGRFRGIVASMVSGNYVARRIAG